MIILLLMISRENGLIFIKKLLKHVAINKTLRKRSLNLLQWPQESVLRYDVFPKK